MEPGGDGFGVFAKDTGPFFDDFHHARIAARGRFKNHGRQRGDFHFVRGLGPANELIEIVQGTRVQNFCGQLHFAAMEIVFAQGQTQRLNDEKIAAAGVAENVSPLPALSILSPRLPVTDEPLPAFTTILPRSSAAAMPESRSLPVIIFAFGQTSAQMRASDCRSSSVPQPARKTPARSICLGSSEKIARKRSGVVRRKFEGGSFP